MSKQLLAAAAWYARNGWHVLPIHECANGRCSCGKADCSSPGKHPRTPNGLHDATTDTQQVLEWWRKWPNANIAIATEPSGLVVVDIDPRSQGDVTFEALRADLGAEPFDTVTAQTPSGGSHYVYATDGTPVNSGAHVLGQGIDTRAIGGYFLVAPSTINGKPYAWEIEYSPKDRKPAMWPDELGSKIVAKKIAAPLSEAGVIPKGERNVTLASVAGTLRRRGLDFDEILGALLVVNAKRCADDPLPQADVERIVSSICRYKPEDWIGVKSVEAQEAVATVVAENAPKSASDIFATIHNRIESNVRALPFGITQLDSKLGGMYPEMVTVVAARTGTGKTAFVEHIIESAATAANVLLFSLEFPAPRIVERMAARHERMRVREYREAGRPMSDTSWLQALNLHIVGRSNKIGIEAIEEQVKSSRPDLVVIDHARHIQGWLSRDGKMRADLSPAFIMQSLGDIATKYRTHILLLSQVNREADGSRPSLGDLRDSGAVEENADNVIMLHRPFQKGDPEPPHMQYLEKDLDGSYIVDNVVEFCVWKSREAGSFIAHSGWRGQYMEFYNFNADNWEEAAVFKRCCNGSTSGRRKGGYAA